MYVYRLRSIPFPTETYIGMTDNPTRRLKEHNSGNSIYTNKFKPWKYDLVVWLPDKTKIYHLEKYLKSHSGKEFAKRHF